MRKRKTKDFFFERKFDTLSTSIAHANKEKEQRNALPRKDRRKKKGWMMASVFIRWERFSKEGGEKGGEDPFHLYTVSGKKKEGKENHPIHTRKSKNWWGEKKQDPTLSQRRQKMGG